ncbi:hypothetical protein Tco_0928086 [Tanacetum coccineum]
MHEYPTRQTNGHDQKQRKLKKSRGEGNDRVKSTLDPRSTTETYVTPVKERYAEYKFEDDDIEDGDDYNNKVHVPHYPFKVEARIEHMMVLLTWKSLILGSISWRFTSHLTLGISIDTEDVLTKYVAGLPRQVHNEMRLYSASNISEASSIAMAIEQKNKISGEKFVERSKGEGSSTDFPKKDLKKGTISGTNANKFCEECNITGHTKEKCWKAHPELFLKKWIKDDRMKRTTATTFVDDTIELRSIKKADKSLSLMVGPQKNSQNTQVKPDEKEELFTMKIQVKHDVIKAIVDTCSQKNSISATLVQKLGLLTT